MGTSTINGTINDDGDGRINVYWTVNSDSVVTTVLTTTVTTTTTKSKPTM